MHDLTKADVANIIDSFLNGGGGKWDWDEFTSFRLDDADLERVRQTCISLPNVYPPTSQGYYCNEQGLAVLREITRRLREGF